MPTPNLNASGGGGGMMSGMGGGGFGGGGGRPTQLGMMRPDSLEDGGELETNRGRLS